LIVGGFPGGGGGGGQGFGACPSCGSGKGVVVDWRLPLTVKNPKSLGRKTRGKGGESPRTKKKKEKNPESKPNDGGLPTREPPSSPPAKKGKIGSRGGI